MRFKYKTPFFATIIIIGFGAYVHSLTYNPQDWNSFMMWVPLYISPVWGFAGYDYLQDRGRK